MSHELDAIYIGYGFPPYFAHAELEWCGDFNSHIEAVEGLRNHLKQSEKDGEIYWCIRHPDKEWKSGTYPKEKPQ